MSGTIFTVHRCHFGPFDAPNFRFSSHSSPWRGDVTIQGISTADQASALSITSGNSCRKWQLGLKDVWILTQSLAGSSGGSSQSTPSVLDRTNNPLTTPKFLDQIIRTRNWKNMFPFIQVHHKTTLTDSYVKPSQYKNSFIFPGTPCWAAMVSLNDTQWVCIELDRTFRFKVEKIEPML